MYNSREEIKDTYNSNFSREKSVIASTIIYLQVIWPKFIMLISFYLLKSVLIFKFMLGEWLINVHLNQCVSYHP